MYLLFRDHHMRPSTIYDMEPGELEVCRAFVRYELDEKQKEYEALKGD